MMATIPASWPDTIASNDRSFTKSTDLDSSTASGSPELKGDDETDDTKTDCAVLWTVGSWPR